MSGGNREADLNKWICFLLNLNSPLRVAWKRKTTDLFKSLKLFFVLCLKSKKPRLSTLTIIAFGLIFYSIKLN